MWPQLSRDQKEKGQIPDAVLVRFDDETIAPVMDVNQVKNGCIIIEPCTVGFQGRRGKSISRVMLPIIHCWAVTIHKMQGI